MISRKNNFDLIRLFAAFQVAVLHLNGHLKIDSPGVIWDNFLECIRPFPGVPIFFTISGFLIFASYDNNQSTRKYFINRYLRIYPLLYVVTVLTALLLLIFASTPLPLKQTVLWFFGQVSVFQYYTPDVLRFFGVGNPNGALWTIPIEIEFYILVPFIYKLYKKFGIVIPALVAFISYPLYSIILSSTLPEVIKKLFETSVLYYLFHFCTGIFLYIYFEKIKSIIVGKGLYWLGGYVLFYIVFDRNLHLYHDLYTPNFIGLIAICILAFTVLSLAFSMPSAAHFLLKGNDYSYGVYVLHMIVANVMVEMLFIQKFTYLLAALCIILIAAAFSWRFVEKPALAFKRKF